MLYLRLSISVCACLLVGCADLTTPSDVPPATGSGLASPEAPAPTVAATTAPAPTGVVQPGQAQDALPSPVATFWVADQPETLPPQAFGPLPPDWYPDPSLTIDAYELKVPLPETPPELDVYQVGDYPSKHLVTAGTSTLKDLRAWEFIPEYSLVQYDGRVPLGTQTLVTTTAQAEQQAAQVLREHGLLMPDSLEPTSWHVSEGVWQVCFFRRIDDVVVYTNKALCVQLNRDGQVMSIIGRRRPLLARSPYPLRSPTDAWQRVMEGEWQTMPVDDGTSQPQGALERFVVTKVELAYVEGEVTAAQQMMQPYYVFRNEQQHAVYVPAVSDAALQAAKQD